MNTIKDVTDYLEKIAPLDLQEAYDNSGLIVGRHSTEVKGVICCLDATEEVVTEAIDLDCNLIVAHHPIIFGGLKKINGYHYVERAVIKAIKHDIAIYACHTNLDNILSSGVNEKIASMIGLEQLALLRLKDEGIGSGVVGKLPGPMPFEAFVVHLIARLELPGLKHTRKIHKDVTSVALCGGSGGFLLRDAIESRAEVFISADFKYHDYFEANDEITIIDIGHHESEKFTTDLLHELISGNFTKFAAYCTKRDTNPLIYKYNNGHN